MLQYLYLLLLLSLGLLWVYLYRQFDLMSRHWLSEYQQARRELEKLRSEYLELLQSQAQSDLAKAKALEWDLQ